MLCKKDLFLPWVMFAKVMGGVDGFNGGNLSDTQGGM